MTTLFENLISDYGQITIRNKSSYIKNEFTQRQWDEAEEKLIDSPDEECLCYLDWYLGPLAASGDFVVINKDGEITKSMCVIIS